MVRVLLFTLITLLVTIYSAKAQTRLTVTGTVTDVQGNPVIGVNVMVKGTATGTTTGADGKYSIQANDGDLLIYSFIGYKTVQELVSQRTVINIKIEEDATALGEVTVNAGYWSVKEQEQTGNISRVTSAEISKQPVTNVLGALGGRLPGVFVQQTSGVPGSGFVVRIRGANSLRGGLANDPLYIIDGVPLPQAMLNSNYVSEIFSYVLSPLNVNNPSDIESIEVLKDADATAVYGSRGSNGVVLLTTKKGKSGKTSVDLNVSHGVSQVGHFMKLLNTQQYIEMRLEALKNDELFHELSDPANADKYPDLMVWDIAGYTDWQKKILGGSPHFSDMRLSVSGGSTNTTFLLSGTYHTEGTVFPGEFSYKRGGTHLNINHGSEDKKFSVLANANLNLDNNNLPMRDITRIALSLPPNCPEKGGNAWQSYYMSNEYTGKTKSITANAVVCYEIVRDLKLKSNVGYSGLSLEELSISPIRPDLPYDGSAWTGSTDVSTWIIEPQMEYSRKIAKGRMIVLAGASFQQSIFDKLGFNSWGYKSNKLLENVAFATDIKIYDVEYSKYRYMGMFGRLNYNWDDKYIVNLTIRRDGSSRFGPGNRFANFGAVGAAWIFSNESFMKQQSVVSFSKLRFSYGVTGSDQVGDYQYQDSYSITPEGYNNVAGLSPSQLANPDYAWENNRKLEVAVDLGFIRDRLMLSACGFRNNSSDQLIGYPLPVITGFNSIQYNYPAVVRNTGLEFEMTTRIISAKRFAWTIDGNGTFLKNELVKFPGIQNSSFGQSKAVGKSISSRNMLHFTGVDPQTGLYTYRDYNGDGDLKYTDDWKIIKRIGPSFFGGFNSTWQVYNFQLDIFFQFVKQQGLNYRYSFLEVPGSMSNQPAEVMNRWQKPGDTAPVQRFSTGLGLENEASLTNTYYKYSEKGIIDASFIRVKNISLSWTVPSAWITKWHLKNVRLYALGQNLLTITKFKGLDPENQSGFNIPPLRVLTIGINVTI